MITSQWSARKKKLCASMHVSLDWTARLLRLSQDQHCVEKSLLDWKLIHNLLSRTKIQYTALSQGVGATREQHVPYLQTFVVGRISDTIPHAILPQYQFVQRSSLDLNDLEAVQKIKHSLKKTLTRNATDIIQRKIQG